MLAEMARTVQQVAIPAPNRLVAAFPPKYTSSKTYCERPENLAKFEQAIARTTGQRFRIEFVVAPGGPAEPDASGPEAKVPKPRTATPQQRLLEKAEHPLVRRAGELFGAFPVRVEEPETARS